MFYSTVDEDLSLEEFVRKYQLPCLAMVKQGYYGNSVNTILDTEQVLRIQGVYSEHRVYGKVIQDSDNCLGRDTSVISLSLSSGILIQVLKKGKMETSPKPLRSILTDNKLPISVQLVTSNNDTAMINVGNHSHQITGNVTLHLYEQHTLQYLYGNPVSNENLYGNVFSILLNECDARLALVSGLTNGDQEYFRFIVATMKDTVDAYVNFEQKVGHQDIYVAVKRSRYQHDQIQTHQNDEDSSKYIYETPVPVKINNDCHVYGNKETGTLKPVVGYKNIEQKSQCPIDISKQTTPTQGKLRQLMPISDSGKQNENSNDNLVPTNSSMTEPNNLDMQNVPVPSTTNETKILKTDNPLNPEVIRQLACKISCPKSSTNISDPRDKVIDNDSNITRYPGSDGVKIQSRPYSNIKPPTNSSAPPIPPKPELVKRRSGSYESSRNYSNATSYISSEGIRTQSRPVSNTKPSRNSQTPPLVPTNPEKLKRTSETNKVSSNGLNTPRYTTSEDIETQSRSYGNTKPVRNPKTPPPVPTKPGKVRRNIGSTDINKSSKLSVAQDISDMYGQLQDTPRNDVVIGSVEDAGKRDMLSLITTANSEKPNDRNITSINFETEHQTGSSQLVRQHISDENQMKSQDRKSSQRPRSSDRFVPTPFTTNQIPLDNLPSKDKSNTPTEKRVSGGGVNILKRSQSGLWSKVEEKALRPVSGATDVKLLTIEELGRYLDVLNLGKHVEKFKEDQVDGCLLQELDEDFLQSEFGFTRFEALKLTKFAKSGYLPKT